MFYFSKTVSLQKILVLFIFVFSLVVYVSTTATLPQNHADSSELITAAFTKGIAHPPSYPLYTFLLGLAMKLPMFTPAYLANLFSAFWQSLSLVFLFLALNKLLEIVSKKQTVASQIIALATTCIFGFNSLVWTYATLAEVFSFNHFFISLFLYLTLLWYQQYKKAKKINWKLFYSSIVVLGLGAAHHQTILFFLPGYVFFLFLEVRRKSQLQQYLISLGLGLLSFLLPFSLLWYFNTQVSPFSWYFEPSLKGVWQIISRALYTQEGSAIETYAHEFNINHSLIALWFYLKYLAFYLTIPGLGLALLGAIQTWQKSKSLSLFLSLTFFISGPLLVFYLKFPLPNTGSEIAYFWGTALRLRMLLPNILVITILIGLGLYFFYQYANKFVKIKKQFVSYLPLVFLILPLYLAASNYQINNLKEDNFDYLFAKKVLTDLPKQAILIVDSDRVFSLLEMQLVEGQRPDVTIVPVTLEMRWPWWQKHKQELILGDYSDRQIRVAHIIAWQLKRGRRVFIFDPETRLLDILGVEGNPFYASVYGYSLEISKTPKPFISYDYGLTKQLANHVFSDYSWWNYGQRATFLGTHTIFSYLANKAKEPKLANEHLQLALSLSSFSQTQNQVYKIFHSSQQLTHSYLEIPPSSAETYLENGQKSMEINDVKTANRYFFRSVLLDPLDLAARQLLIESYKLLGQHNLAKEEQAALHKIIIP
ncbi:DUF2723 domain-containing protein [Candidatus Beckwithbacteria bacterium]|nr:DUF2723 domain-containing protein [Candidatus Beckwithbacteria bacterium]